MAGRLVDSGWWFIPALLLVAGLSLVFRRRLPRPWAWAGFVLSVSAVGGLIVVERWATPSGGFQGVARACSVLALFWSVGAAAVRLARRDARSAGHAHEGIVGVAFVIALLLGVVAAIIQALILVMRIVCVAVDIVNGYPYLGTREYGYAPDGLWSLGLLFGACAISAVSTGDRRLWTAQFWIAIMAVSWACLLLPSFEVAETGGFEASATLLLLVAGWSAVLTSAVAVSTCAERRLVGVTSVGATPSIELPSRWPGFTFSATTVAVGVVLLVCFHLAAPLGLGRGGFRTAALIASGSAVSTALACLVLVWREWNAPLIDAAFGLLSFGVCGIATLAVPSEPAGLSERYPMLFTAMIIGLATATGFWTWLAVRLRARRAAGTVTQMDRLIPHARRFAFLNAALALLLAAAMAMWPRWPAIATMDDTPGRVTAGFAANLFLLLVMLWCSRQFRGPTFQVLTVLSVGSGAAFLLVRMLPFASGSS